MERQTGPLSAIRADHVARYRLAASVLEANEVLDLACGCGYGSRILHDEGFNVTGVDIDFSAIAYARKNYPGPAYVTAKAEKWGGPWDCLVSFETLEHLDDPAKVLDVIRPAEIIASVPNEEHYPFKAEIFAVDKYPHRRHYLPDEFRKLLADFRVIDEWCQKDKGGAIYPGLDGMFMIIHGRR